MPLNFNPLEINDFTGGLSDEPLDCDPNQYTRADNLLLTPEKNLTTRPGSVLFDVANARLPSGNQRVNGLINYNQDTNLLAISGTNIYVYSAGWTPIVGATGVGLPTVDPSYTISTAEWKKQIFVASSGKTQPMKIIKDDTRGWQSITAGLPVPSSLTSYNAATQLAAAIVLANSIRTKMAVFGHYVDTGLHRSSDNVSNGLVAAAATDLPSLITLTNSLTKAFTNHFNDAWFNGIYHLKDVQLPFGTSTQSDEKLVSILDVTTLETAIPQLDDIAKCFNHHTHHHGTHKDNSTGDTYRVDTDPIYGVVTGPYALLDISYIYSFANTLKSKYNSHVGHGGTTTTAHSTSADGVNVVGSADASSSLTLGLLLSGLATTYSNHETDAQKASGWSYHVATEATDHSLDLQTYAATNLPNQALDGLLGQEPRNWSRTITFLNHLRTVFNGHISDWTAHYTTNPSTSSALSLHDVDSIPGTLDMSLGNYLYAIVYKYSYTIDGVLYETRGEPQYVEIEDVMSIDLQALTLQNIAPLVNSGDSNYDVSNVTIEIYRTINNGTVYFLSGTLANTGSSALSYSDSVKDADLITRQPLYTEGGVSPNSLPPKAKFVHIVNDTGFWANVTDGTEVLSQRIRQSIPGEIDACPGDYFVDLPFTCTGFSSTKGVKVAWTAKATYRIDGSIDELGQGSLTATEISDSVGNIGQFSPVSTDLGIVFAGTDQFYLTNGYQVSPLGRDWKDTYANLIRNSTSSALIQGVVDKKTSRVWWAVSQAGTENDSCFIVDMNFPMSDSACWTSASNGAHFAPSSLTFFNNQLIRGDSRGYVFKHDTAYTNDPKVNTGIAASGWNTKAIFPDYRSPAFDFGSIKVRKWVPRIVTKFKNLGNLSLQINSINDDGRNIAALAPIRYRGSTDYGDSSILSVGGGPTITNGGIPEYRRRFPSGSMRCSTKQLQFILAKIVITESDSLGLGVLNQAAKTLTVSGASFPDYVDHVVSLANDGYVREYTITSNTGTVITVSDPGAHLPIDGSYKWVVRGYPKDEKWEIHSYCLYYDLYGTTQIDGADSTGDNT